MGHVPDLQTKRIQTPFHTQCVGFSCMTAPGHTGAVMTGAVCGCLPPDERKGVKDFERLRKDCTR